MSFKLNSGSTEFTGKDLTSSVQLLTYTATRDFLLTIRIDLGKSTSLLASAAADYTIIAKVTKSDSITVEAYSKTVAKPTLQTSFSHTLDKSIYVQEGEVVAVWVLSTSELDLNISGDMHVLGIRSSGGSSLVSYTRDTLAEWLETEFLPLTLATPSGTIQQVIQNAIRYFNTHSGYKISKTYTYASGTTRIQLDTSFKTVVQVYPTTTSSWIWNDHPLWTLLGISVLDNVTTDLIMMSEAFKNYRVYIGADMRWTYNKSEDPDVEGGHLYIINLPPNNDSVFVVGTQRITADDTDIKSEYILDWVLNYAKALLMMIEGNTLRKSSIVGVNNDGQALVNEGNELRKELQEKLGRDGRWVAMIRRF